MSTIIALKLTVKTYELNKSVASIKFENINRKK